MMNFYQDKSPSTGVRPLPDRRTLPAVTSPLDNSICCWLINGLFFRYSDLYAKITETIMQPIAHNAVFSPWEPGIFSLVIFGVIVIGLIAAMHFLSAWVGVKKDNPEKLRPYESGIIPTGAARLRYPVPFFMVAIFFLIFDVEGAYIFSWAIACKDLGWQGWMQMSFFIFVLLLGLVYIWRKGGLDWGPEIKKDPTQ